MDFQVVVLGFGGYGRAVARLLALGGGRGRLAGVYGGGGAVIVGGPGDLVRLARIVEAGGGLGEHPGFREGLGPVEAAIVSGADVAVVASPLDGASVRALLEEGLGLIVVDAGTAVEAEALAEAAGPCVFYTHEPALALGAPLAGALRAAASSPGPVTVYATLSPAVDALLWLIASGVEPGEAEARVEAEAGEPLAPEATGWAPAARLALAARLLGLRLSPEAVVREPASSLDPSAARAAVEAGRDPVMLASIEPGGRARVGPALLEARSPPRGRGPWRSSVEAGGYSASGPAGRPRDVALTVARGLAEFESWLRVKRWCGEPE